MEDYIVSALPQLTPEISGELEAPITLSELQDALNASKLGKAPGPDGFPLQYYKKFIPLLCPHMVELFNKVGTETLPQGHLGSTYYGYP